MKLMPLWEESMHPQTVAPDNSVRVNVLFGDRKPSSGEKEIKQFLLVAGEIGSIFKDQRYQPQWVVVKRDRRFVFDGCSSTV
jgi:hypothetical protein